VPDTSRNTSEEPAPEPASAPSSETKGAFTVVLDAGHGGKDPGAVGKKVGDKALQEKDATLAIAKMVRDELRGRKGVRIVLTRDQDEFLSLGERTRIANKEKGDLFVSIHCNSLPMASKRRDEVQGFMVYLLREAKSEADRAIERRENEAIRFETGERQRKDALSPLEWVMLEHQLNLYTKESERFAEILVKNMESKGPVKKERTGAGQAGFFVLVGALMPSVLIETGYVSNENDAENLGSTSGRKAIARQIARSIEEFQRSRP
jgi:N-acetylmuramoyl-L-alanine amidase